MALVSLAGRYRFCLYVVGGYSRSCCSPSHKSATAIHSGTCAGYSNSWESLNVFLTGDIVINNASEHCHRHTAAENNRVVKASKIILIA